MSKERCSSNLIVGNEKQTGNLLNDFLRVGKKLSNFEKKDCFQTIAATQLSVIGQVTSSAFPA